MPGLKAIRPYVVRDGKAYCGKCRRRRLARIEETRFVCCSSCDAGELPEEVQREVQLVKGRLFCGACGRHELVPAPRGGELECPECDTPPWERKQVAQPAWKQDTLDLGPAPVGVGSSQGEGDDPTRPAPAVRTCFFCRQTCWHHAERRFSKWVMVCDGCGNRLSASRARSAATKRQRGARQ